MRIKEIKYSMCFLVTIFLFLITISFVMGASAPADPTTLTNSTGNFWINYTWIAGTGNTTDCYNVSYNGTWDNTTCNTYRNESVGAHGYLDIIVYAYNSSDGGALSGGCLTDNVTVPNNVPTSTNLLTAGETDPMEVFSNTPTFSWTYSDDDNDIQYSWEIYVGTTSGASDKWNSGQLVGADVSDVYAGSSLTRGTLYYVQVRTNDSYANSTWATGTFTLGTFDPPNPITLINNTGNFWVNYTWSPGSGNVTDKYNVSYNGTWDNTSSNAYRNESVGAHGYLDIIIYAYNTTGNTLSSGSLTDNVTVPNNVPTQSSSHTDLGTHLIDHTPTITWTEGTDTDGDTITTYIYVGTTSTPTVEEGNTTSETLDLGSVVTLNDGTTYYWRTRSWDGYAYSDYTASDEFRMNTPPTVATSLTDLGMNLIDHSPAVTWTKGSDAEGDTVNTYIYVGTGVNPTTEEGHNTGTTIDLGSTVTLSDGVTYYWRTRSYDGYEWSSYTADDQFRMNTPPTVPTSPTDLGTHLTDHTPDVSWTASTDAESDGITYYVESQDSTAVWDADWNGAGVSTLLDANTWDDGEAGKWRVKAYDGYENSSYTTEDTFQMNTLSTTTSLLTAGETNPTEVFSATPTFSWTYGDGDSDAQTHWEIYVGTGSGLSDKWSSGQLVGADVSDVYAGSSLTRGTLYYVQVRTTDGYEWSTWATGTFILGTFNPPDPTNLANTTGNYWVNYTWSTGSGNVTDSYNVSYNGTWDNTSSDTFRNESVGVHGFLDIEVYAYNNTGDILSAGSLTDNITVPNNPITITNTSDYDGMENIQALIDFDYTDPDNDTPIFQTNATVGSLNSSTGVFTWIPSSSDAGTHYFEFNVSDGYGSVNTYISTFLITAFELTSPNPPNNTNIIKGMTPTFSIFASAAANSTWTLDDVLEDTDINNAVPDYIIPSDLDEGSHKLVINSAMVSNLSVTEEFLWNFTIEAAEVLSSGGTGGSSTSSSTSNEPLINILCKEVGYIGNIRFNEITSYSVRNQDCLKITSISFVPYSNSREEAVYIEGLVDKSYFVPESVPNHEIFNFNLFVGALDYDHKTKHEKISFKLKKTVIRNNELDENKVNLFKWSTDKKMWIRKYTELTSSDEHYYYYESDSGATSGNFAIAGEEFIFEEEPLSLLEKFREPDDLEESTIKSFFNYIGSFINNLIGKCFPGSAS